ncbi:MAG: AI-2E family transporter [Lysobacterales bacterium]
MNPSRVWQGLILLLLIGALLALLAPVLTPFAASALFAYLGDPIVDRLERRVSRGTGVTIVFAVMTLAAVLVLAVLIPEVLRQAGQFPGQLEKLHAWFDRSATPWLASHFGFSASQLDPGNLLDLARNHLQDLGRLLPQIFLGVGKSGATLLGILANLLLIPVITFYLLRDWDLLTRGLRELLPRPLEPAVVKLVQESDQVLASFVRGQLSVMVLLGTFYALGLSLAQVQFGLLIGFLAGLLSFVPYLGPAVGIGAGLISAVVSPGDPWVNTGLVLAVFATGQVLESFVLTPWLVGDRIGLHPVAVIFAVMAGGQLFGFFGILLALPVAAVVMVLLRAAHQRYLGSHLYDIGDAPTPNAAVTDAPPADDGDTAAAATEPPV